MPVLVSRLPLLPKYVSFRKISILESGINKNKISTSIPCVYKTYRCFSIKKSSFTFNFSFRDLFLRISPMEGDNKSPLIVITDSVDKANTSNSATDESISKSELTDGKCEDSLRFERNNYEDVGKAASVLRNNWKEIEEALARSKTTDRVRKKKSKKKVFVNSEEEDSDCEYSSLKVKLPNRNYIGVEEVSNSCRSVIIQCHSSLETSNVVLKLTHSDTEDIPEEASEEVKNEKIVEADLTIHGSEKRKASDEVDINKDLKKAKLETKALKAKRPGFTDERYNETSYYIENGLRKVYPYYFTFTTFTKGRWVGEKILDVFAREFRAHPAEEYERCIRTGSLTVNYEKVDVDYRLKHNDLLANVVHRHEVPVTADPIAIIHMDEDVVVVNKPASIPNLPFQIAPAAAYLSWSNRHETPVLAKSLRLVHVDDDIVALDKPCSLPVHPCGRYRHNTVVFILAKEYQLRNLRTIHRLDRLTSGLLLFGRTPKKARQMEQQIRNRQVQKEYVCRVEGEFPDEVVKISEPIEVVSYKIGVCKVSPKGKECSSTFHKLGYNPESNTSVVLCLPHSGRMHQIRVHLQYLGYPVVNDPLYNHTVFGPEKGKGGRIGKTDEELIRDLISIHNAENWLGMDGDSELSMFKPMFDDDDKVPSREPSPCENGSPGGMVQSQPPQPLIPPAPCPAAPAAPRPLLSSNKVTVATQTGHEAPDLIFNPDRMTTDQHCYECKVKYRDPKPRDLVMYLHAWKYRGPGWSYETELPDWARVDWMESDAD